MNHPFTEMRVLLESSIQRLVSMEETISSNQDETKGLIASTHKDSISQLLALKKEIYDVAELLKALSGDFLLFQKDVQEKFYLAEDIKAAFDSLGKNQEDLFKQLKQQQEDIENLNALLRRNIHDTNEGFWNLERGKRNRFGGQHSIYNDEFFRNNQYNSMISGVHVLRAIMKRISINNVVDFGCGTGTWLYAAKILNASIVAGYDGDYVNRKLLLIDEEDFYPCNLENPIQTDRKYDLAISVEVAEHLPESAADTFIDSITGAADIVLFSAAHVGQGGDNHINEQPFSYWKDKFENRGYGHIEIRPFYAGDWEIESWYRENIGLYVKKEKFDGICEKLKIHG